MLPLLALLLLACGAPAVNLSGRLNLGGRPGLGYVVLVDVGTPPQRFNVVLDTGSANFAIAGVPHPNIEKYFIKNYSSTYKDLNEDVSVVYSQGKWSGELSRDVAYFPTLNSVPAVECEITFINDSSDFYMNGSDWQGVLGLAYPAIAKPSSNVRPWIDYLQLKNKDKTIAFSLTLCGPGNANENRHNGSFEVLNNMMHPYPGLMTALIVREWFYEIVLTGLLVNGVPVLVDCRSLNTERAIVDSGTTTIELPKIVFMELVKSLIFASNGDIAIDEDFTYTSAGDFPRFILNNNSSDKFSFTNEFWLEQQKVCWPMPQTWNDLPTINIEIASSSDTFFRINLPPSSYIRQKFDDVDENYCYKFAIEPSDTGTILGVIAMEGFQVIFNRSSRSVGFIKSDCGPNVSIEGPFHYVGDDNLIEKCGYNIVRGVSLLNIAFYIVCFALFCSSCIFGYIFVQWIKNKYFKYRRTDAMVSMSHANLINESS